MKSLAVLLLLTACGPRAVNDDAPVVDAYVRVVGFDPATTSTIQAAAARWSRYGFSVEPYAGQDGGMVVLVQPKPALPDGAAAITYCGDDGCDIQVSILATSDSFESVIRHEFGHALVSGSHLAPGQRGLMATFVDGPTEFSPADDAWVCAAAPARCLP